MSTKKDRTGSDRDKQMRQKCVCHITTIELFKTMDEGSRVIFVGKCPKESFK